jgi:hypothetical protein
MRYDDFQERRVTRDTIQNTCHVHLFAHCLALRTQVMRSRSQPSPSHTGLSNNSVILLTSRSEFTVTNAARHKEGVEPEHECATHIGPAWTVLECGMMEAE